jgi:uncharacterized protein with HEPN domain
MDQPRLADYIDHMLDAVTRIQAYTANIDEAAFRQSTLIQDAVIRNIEILGEASNQVLQRYPEFATAHPEVPLRAARQMRNVLTHGYFTVNLAVVWQTITHDLPTLWAELEQIRTQIGNPADTGPDQ